MLSILKHSRKYEKEVPYPYLDSNGNLTAGIGHNFDTNRAEFIAAKWSIRGSSKRYATSEEKSDTFNNILRIKKSLNNDFNKKSLFYADKTPLYLPSSEIHRFAEKDIAVAIKSSRSFIGSEVFDRLTPDQRLAIVDIEFNTSKIEKFKSLREAAKAGDAVRMAKESLIYVDKNQGTGMITRNWDRLIANYQLMSGKSRKDTLKDLAGIFKGREKNEASMPEDLKKMIKELFRGVTQLLCQGVVAVSAYIRGSGTEVDSYDRACPGMKDA